MANIKFKNIHKSFGSNKIISNFNLEGKDDEFLVLVGPSGCGKSTFLRCLNRMNDVIDNCKVEGSFIMNDTVDIYSNDLPIESLREKIGMVFQKPNPFPKSIYENVAYGPKIHGITSSQSELDDVVKESLNRAGLYEEVKDRLDDVATGLSGGQQQRLCIARAISIKPEIILMDENGEPVRSDSGNPITYPMSVDAILSIEDGSAVKAGDVVARIPREGAKT